MMNRSQQRNEYFSENFMTTQQASTTQRTMGSPNLRSFSNPSLEIAIKREEIPFINILLETVQPVLTELLWVIAKFNDSIRTAEDNDGGEGDSIVEVENHKTILHFWQMNPENNEKYIR